MTRFLLPIVLFAVSAVLPAGAVAGVCDYRPSRLMGQAGAVASTAVSGGAAVAEAGLQVAGYYSLLQGGSGLSLLGSLTGGAGAAGATGVIAGAGQAIGGAAAILSAPATLAVGAVTFASAGAYEGFCYFRVERVDDPEVVRAIIESIAAHDPLVSIVATNRGPAMELAAGGSPRLFLLRNLYLEDGQLRHRDWGPNTDLGAVVFKGPETAGE
jgi:hypothetical protein